MIRLEQSSIRTRLAWIIATKDDVFAWVPLKGSESNESRFKGRYGVWMVMAIGKEGMMPLAGHLHLGDWMAEEFRSVGPE